MFIKPNSMLGVGVNFRGEIAENIVNNLNDIDFVEINTERFFHQYNNQYINKIIETVPIVLHGLSLSIGTVDKIIDENYLLNLDATLKKINCEWFSEHIAITNVNGLEIRSLMPVEFNHESVHRIINNVKKIKEITSKPFLLENITYYYSMPNSGMAESEFISEIVNKADCGLLLDLNNLYVNSINHKYDPYKYIDQLPSERIVEVHIAGCDYMHNMLIDTHASPVRNEVLSLLKYLSKKIHINGVVIERDAKLNNFNELLNEVKTIRNLLTR